MSATHYENNEILLIFSARASKEKEIEKQFEYPDYSNRLKHLKEGMTLKKNRTAPFFPC